MAGWIRFTFLASSTKFVKWQGCMMASKTINENQIFRKSFYLLFYIKNIWSLKTPAIKCSKRQKKNLEEIFRKSFQNSVLLSQVSLEEENISYTYGIHYGCGTIYRWGSSNVNEKKMPIDLVNLQITIFGEIFSLAKNGHNTSLKNKKI